MALLLLLIATAAFLSGSGPLSDGQVGLDRGAGGVQRNTTVAPNVSCAVPKRRNVYLALDELFTCLVDTHVQGSELHKVAATRLKFGRQAGSGAAQGPLLTGIFSTGALISSHQSHRLYYGLAPLFPPELGRNESRAVGEAAAKLDAYLSHLEVSPYVVDTYLTLSSNDALPDEASSLRDFVRVVMFNHWFKPYARQARLHSRGLMESSGFGHVFVGEISERGVTGFHNWLSILAAEESGAFEYRGVTKVVNKPLVLASIQFGWLGKEKPLSSFAFGVETEFQLALFSACFVVKPGRKTRLRMAGVQLAVQTYAVNHQPESVGSAYFVL